MPDLFEKFVDFVDALQLIHKNDEGLVAVSGGVDSMVLLHLLQRLAQPLQLTLRIVHLNHRLRGEQSDRDQRFVEQVAETYGLPIMSRSVNVPKLMAKKGLAEEEAARLSRYRFFRWALKKTNADWLALGHQADDQVETVIDHFLRGSGVKGLAGMSVRREKFIRPLLFARRSEIETYAKANSLHYQIDSTNAMTRYRRNRIRLELIPDLQQRFNSAIPEIALRTAHIMAEVETYLNEQAKLAFDSCCIYHKKNKIILDIDAFLNYFIIIQKYMLYQSLDRLQVARSILTTSRLKKLLSLIRAGNSGKKMMLTPQWQILIDRGQLIIHRHPASAFEIEIEPNQKVDLFDGELRFSSESLAREQLPKEFSNSRQIEFVDSDKIRGRLVIRTVRAGDRFQPLNLDGEKKVSDFFTDRKIPLHQRKEIPLLVCDAGIIWIIGHQIDDRFKIRDETQHVLKLQIEKGKA